MPSVARYTPPETRGDRVLRPDVQRTLSGRFDRPLTVLSAGAGFGKTTALVQMLTENRLAPMGVDVWLACEAADRDPRNLIAGIAGALDIEAAAWGEGLPDAVVDSIAARAPTEVCLVVDDVHWLGTVAAPTDGAAVLADLVTRLPANGHVVLAGRSQPPIPISRMVASGECAVVDEVSLRLEDRQVETLAKRAGLDPADFSTLAGWPALVALAMGRRRPLDFVQEEILRDMASGERALLDGLVAAGHADAAMLAAITGVDDQSALDAIPLVERRGDDYVAHDLWRTIIGDDTAEIAALRERAVAHLLDDRRYVEAVEIAMREGADVAPGRLDAALVGALDAARIPDRSTLRRWTSSLDAAAGARAAGLLLRGLTVRLDDPTDESCRAMLESAAAGFRADGDLRGEAEALSALTYVQHVHRDASGLQETYTRLVELADAGVGEARDQRRLAMAVTATATGALADVEGIVAPIIEGGGGRTARGVALWLHFNALNGLGRPAREAADELARTDVSLPGFAVARLSAQWRAGQLDRIPDDPPVPVGGARDRFLHAVWMTFVACGFGDLPRARRHLAEVRTGAGDASRLMGDGSDVMPEVAVRSEAGDVDGAAALLRGLLDAHPLDGPSHGFYVMALGLVYPLLPETRDHFDGLRLGELFHRDLDLNRAHLAAAEDGELAGARAVSLPERATALLPALGCRRAAEFLAAAWSADHPDAPRLTEEFGRVLGPSAREAFRRAADHEQPAIADGATAVLGTIPVEPSHSVDIALFGGAGLLIDHVPVDAADWRRVPVQKLLVYLALSGQVTREQAIGALWPDVDPEAGRRRLRSTLNRLHTVLEPDRSGGDAPFFVRSTGPILRLVPGASLRVDVATFLDAADAAERLDREGTPSLALPEYLRAVEVYAGDLLPAHYDDWLLGERDRLRIRFLRAAVRGAELLTASGDPMDAVDLALRALQIDPYVEAAHRALIAAHLAAGNRAEAGRALARFDAEFEEMGGPVEEATRVLRRRVERALDPAAD